MRIDFPRVYSIAHILCVSTRGLVDQNSTLFWLLTGGSGDPPWKTIEGCAEALLQATAWIRFPKRTDRRAVDKKFKAVACDGSFWQ